MKKHQKNITILNIEDLPYRFRTMHDLSRREQPWSWQQRKDLLTRLEQLLQQYKQVFIEAINKDFGHRSSHESQFAEILPALEAIRFAKKHGKKWMKTRRVSTSWLYLPAKSQIQPQPLGVVGIIVPWNYPLFLAIGPIVDALVAGNRIIIKMSEFSPNFSQAFADAVTHYFSEDEISVVLGEVEIAKAFCNLPFDKILYTGSTEVGKQIMQSAAKNLTPVVLELGGKSPVIILDDANLEKAVSRIMMGKTLNAGQTCISPDYVLLPKKYHQSFIELAKQWVQTHYTDIKNNIDYTHLINDKQFQRVQSYVLEQPQEKIHRLTDVIENAETRLFPPIIITEPDIDSKVMQQEIFAPILPIIDYQDIAHAIDFVNKRPRPLVLYVFGNDTHQLDFIQKNTVSGGMCINETLLHITQHNLPFGGIGNSGIGVYHGEMGFKEMSHMKSVFIQSKINAMSLLLPPYGKLMDTLLAWLLKH